MKRKRGQAAVEFLTTYGWALMAVILVIGVLSYFNILDSSRFVSERCEMGSQIQCLEVYANDLDDGTSNFQIAFRNNYPVNIIVEQVIVEGIPMLSSDVHVSTGNLTYLSGNVGTMKGGNKEKLDVVITFRRDAVGTAKYNISGSLVVKVQDSTESYVPPNQICGNNILEGTEQCDTSTTRTCSSFGLLGSTPVNCIDCLWNTGVCTTPTGPVCHNGVVESPEECEDLDTTTCSALHLPGSSQVTCGSACSWDTSVCTESSNACTYGTECVGGQICINGFCNMSCNLFTDNASCGNSGCKCSDNSAAYTNSGICTFNRDTDTTFCDKNIAVLSEGGLFLVNCSMQSINMLCDNNSLAGGYSSTGVCVQSGSDYICGSQGGGAINQSSICQSGTDCGITGLCVNGICSTTCTNSMLCSNSSVIYQTDGVCVTPVEGGDDFCDKILATNKTGILYSNCQALDSWPCDSGALSGGYVADGTCVNNVCNVSSGGSIQSEGGLPDGSRCSTGLNCTSNLCVEGRCSSTCTNAQLCSNSSNSFDLDGTCVISSSLGLDFCDKNIAVMGVELYSDCILDLEGVECSSGSLAGGYVKTGTCASEKCVP
ncbi:MAG: hypothetical protein WC758_00850 [Candidatus Woesearchaeota archaeon]